MCYCICETLVVQAETMTYLNAMNCLVVKESEIDTYELAVAVPGSKFGGGEGDQDNF